MTEQEHRFRELTDREEQQFASLPLNEQYATFCGLGDEDDFSARYEAGLEDFRRLIHLKGVEEVGINWHARLLVVGTEEIVAEMELDGKNVRKLLGHYLICITDHQWYSITNISNAQETFAHPHASQNAALCMTDSQILRLAFADGKISEAVELILAALRMDERVVQRGVAYHALHNWPDKED